MLGVTLLPFSPSQAQQVLDRILAVVDDDIILESEVAQGAYLTAMQYHIDPAKSPREFARLKSETLNNLINQKILLVQADKDTVKADEQQVERYLQQQMANVIQQLGGEDKVEEYFGAPLAKVRRNYREEIERNLRIRTVQSAKMQGIKISRREVEQYYKANKDSIGPIKETIDLSHILIKAAPGEAARKAAFDKAEALRARILAGEDFATLARENSEDPGSASRGGDLGFMSRGEFVREFEEAAFKLAPGEISPVITSQFGYHIIQMIERRGEKIDTRHILIVPKPSREDEIAAADTIKAIAKKLKEGANFTELVQRYSQDESSKADKGHLGIFEIDQLRERAKEFVFAVTGLKEGDYSDPVRTQYGFHILRVDHREAARELDFTKDYDRVHQLALDHKMQQTFNAWIAQLKEDIHVEIKDQFDR
ncbi:MAG TPA: peptidylprolyl isomerase [bacterium]|nr:peptidylprolyl isomerase [bacterium]